MKTYSIGRDVNCNIVINDNTDVISRRHAVLNVDSSGKMTIVDQSRNGTYVNGMRIAENVPVPVTRKDNVSFAHVARLDWNMVPKTYSPLMYVGIALLVALLAVGAYFGIKALNGNGGDGNEKETEVVTDTAKSIVLTPEQVKHREDSIRDATLKQIKEEQEKQRVKDSIDRETAKKVEQVRQDSIRRVKEDSIARVKKEKQKKVKQQPKPQPKPQPEQQPKEEKRF